MRWYAKEVYQRETLKYRSLHDSSLEKLRTSIRKQKYVSGICNYDILSNQTYADSFFYSNLSERIDKESSDSIMTILNLGEDKHYTLSNPYQIGTDSIVIQLNSSRVA